MSEGKRKYADRLKSMKADFGNAQKQASIASGDEPFPEGTYLGKVTAKIRETNNGDLSLSRTFYCIDGEYAGLPCYDMFLLEHSNPSVAARGQRNTVQFLALLGYTFDPDEPENLEAILEELSEEAPVVQFRVRHSIAKDGSGRVFTNIDVLDTVSVGEIEGTTTVPVDTAEQGVPEGLKGLSDFFNAHGLEWENGQPETIEDFKEAIYQYDFGPKEITADEKKLLIDNELGSCIKKK